MAEFKPINFQPLRNVNRISDDFCAVTKRERESQKPMKYMITPFCEFKKKEECRGIYFHDGKGVPGCGIDVDSKMKNGQMNTNPNLPQGLPALPLATTGSHVGGMGQGDVDTEFMLRGKDTNSAKTCLPADHEFYKRSFTDFNSLCRKPQELKHTVQNSHGFRGGVSTRQNKK
jgi:hypothetical protein